MKRREYRWETIWDGRLEEYAKVKRRNSSQGKEEKKEGETTRRMTPDKEIMTKGSRRA